MGQTRRMLTYVGLNGRLHPLAATCVIACLHSLPVQPPAGR